MTYRRLSILGKGISKRWWKRMANCNAHGEWVMTFENRILNNKPTVAANEEGCIEWFEELKHKVLSSSEGDTIPWVLLADLRNWEGLSIESWPIIDEVATWQREHNCVLIAVLPQHQLHKYTNEKYLNDGNKSILRNFYDYDEAYQACLDKLAESRHLLDN